MAEARAGIDEIRAERAAVERRRYEPPAPAGDRPKLSARDEILAIYGE